MASPNVTADAQTRNRESAPNVPKEGDSDAYLTLEEAADYTRQEIATLKAAMRARKIQFTKPGRRPTFTKTWLNAWMDKHVVPVQENAHGLTDAALANVLDARPTRARRNAS